MKYLLVGDVHADLDNLDESRRLIRWIVPLVKKYGALPIFMGDQYSKMAIIRAEVLEFWVWAYNHINAELSGNEYDINSISLVGNHDLNSDGSASSMRAHAKQTMLAPASADTAISKNIAAIGYTRDNDTFIKMAQAAYRDGVRTILCHAEFNGAKYDNGFYAPQGIDLESCPPVLFISGHIHTKQEIKSEFTKVLYVGTPRQLTRSDIGEVKGVHLWETDTNEMEFIPTPADVAEPFQQITITSEVQLATIPNSPRVYVDVHGSADFIKKTLKKMPESAKVRTFPDQERSPIEIKESDGIPAAFVAFSNKYFIKKALDDNTKKNALSIIYEKCPALRGNNG